MPDAPTLRRGEVTTASLLAGLSHALDLTEGHPRGHAERSCAIALALADELQISRVERGHLVHATLLKDAGCSSNAARVYQLFGGPEHGVKRAVWERDWRRFGEQLTYVLGWAERGGSAVARVRRVASLAKAGPSASRELFQIRCARGAEIATRLGFPAPVVSAIHDMDEHWDGGGHPRGLAGRDIPLLAQIIGLSQVMEIFWGLGGPEAALGVVRDRAGSWFGPHLSRAAAALVPTHGLWARLLGAPVTQALLDEVPPADAMPVTAERLSRIAEAFALIIDGKSPYTFSHSDRVAGYAVTIGRRLGLDAPAVARLRLAALVHDLGKLTVPNSILDSPRPLTPDEWQVVKRHPAYTGSVLERVPVLAELAADAAAHHERIDGKGYHLGLGGPQLSVTARVLAVADVTDALAADRPYRAGMAPEDVVRILRQDAGTHLCPACVDACTADVVAAGAAA